MEVFYKIWKNYNEIKLTKIKMNLNSRKMKNHRPSPVALTRLVDRRAMVPSVTEMRVAKSHCGVHKWR